MTFHPASCIEHTIIVDTDQYAGNFEQEMLAYVFGYDGAADRCRQYLDAARREDGSQALDELLEMRDGERGETCVMISSTPGTSMPCSVAFFITREPTQAEGTAIKKRVEHFVKVRAALNEHLPRLKIISLRLCVSKTLWEIRPLG